MDDGPPGSVETTPNRLAQQGAVSTPAQVAAQVTGALAAHLIALAGRWVPNV